MKNTYLVLAKSRASSRGNTCEASVTHIKWV